MKDPMPTLESERIEVKTMAPGELTSIATRGAFWNIGLAFANKIFTLVGQVILAWLLAPKDMGLASMATAMAGIVFFMNASGVTDVLIQRRRYKEEASQGLWLSLFLSACTAILIACLSPVASWMGHPDLSKMLLILAFLPLVDALSPVLSASLKTDLNFKYFAVCNFFSGVTYTTCAVVLAFMGMGAYSLILPVIPRSIANWILMIPKTGWPKIEKPNFQFIKNLISPSISVSFTGFLNALQQQVPIFMVGLVTNFTVTGHFSWGWQVASQSVFLLSTNLRQVLMPTLAKIGHDPERQAAAAFRATRAITALLTIACGLQALLAQPLLDKFFPEKWHPAGPVITWISIGLVFQGVYVCLSSWLNAAGRYRDLVVVTALPVVLSSGFAYWGALVKGAEGAALGSALGIILSALLSLTYMPLMVLKKQAKMFLIPFFISSVTFMSLVLINFYKHDFLFYLLGSIVFFIISSTAWWRWGGEQFRDFLRNLVEKLKVVFSPVEARNFKAIIPNFFIIGAPKSGTTALSEYLRDNPNVFLTTPKEPLYFSSDLTKFPKMSKTTYLSLFSSANPEKHKAIGEASTSYLFSKRAVPEILKLNENAKLIVMLRNPIEIVQALHSTLLYLGIENILDFEKAWYAQEDRKIGKRMPFLCLEPIALMYSEWGKVGEQVERLFSIVKREQVKVILFDDFIGDTKKIYNEVLEYLGVQPDEKSVFPKFNDNKRLIFPWMQPYLAFPMKIAKGMRVVFGFPKNAEMFLNLLAVNAVAAKRFPISDVFKSELIEFYKSDILKLSRLLERDLSCWLSTNKQNK